jgi:hypothetical protein
VSDGARLSLANFGAPAAQANLSAPAKLRLFAVFSDKAREAKDTTELLLGHLEGGLTADANGGPAFAVNMTAEGKPSVWVLPPSEGEPVGESRMLRFEFAGGQFQNAPGASEAGLLLRVEYPRFKYMEVQAELEVDGKVTASRQVNDCLDVLVNATNPPSPFKVNARVPERPPSPPEPPKSETDTEPLPRKSEPPKPKPPEQKPPKEKPKPKPKPMPENPDLDLDEVGDDDEIIPLLMNPDTTFGASKVKFDLEIEGEDDFVADTTEVAILRGTTPVFTQTFSSGDYLRKPGDYVWEWDGYDDNRVLDTVVLKDPTLILQVTVNRAGHAAKQRLELLNEANNADWVDVKIDLNAKQVELTFFINCQNEDGIEAGEYQRLVDLVKSGISKYWSRPIRVDDKTYQVNVSVKERKADAVDLDIYISNDKDYSRSHNSGIIDGSMFYNLGFWGNKADADTDFQEVAGHEFGHSVLDAFAGKEFSWTHKGCTSLFQQPNSHATPHPKTGEIDLMKYYTDGQPADFYSRVIASEEDVKRAINIAAVDFDD